MSDVEVVPAAAGTGAPPTLWRNRSFNLLWSSQLLSELGSTMTALAFPLLVLALSGSPVRAGAVGTAGTVVRALVRLPAGVLVDRVNRRWAMLGCDAARLAGFALLGVLVLAGRATLVWIMVAAVVEAAGSAVFMTAERAALRSVVALSQLSGAVARNEARSAVASLAGPPLGGALFSLGHAVPFLGDALSYLLSMIGIGLIRTPMQQPRTRTRDSALAQVREGISFVLRQPFLRAVLLIAAPTNLAFAGMLFTVVVVLRQHGTAPAVIGLVESIIGIGALLGALAAPALTRRIPVRGLVLGICWAGTALMAVSSLLTRSILVAVPVALAVALAPACNAALFGYQSAITPDRLQGRVISVVLLGATLLAGAAPILAGVLIVAVGGPVTVLCCAGALALAALTATLSRGIRTMRPAEELAAGA